MADARPRRRLGHRRHGRHRQDHARGARGAGRRDGVPGRASCSSTCAATTKANRSRRPPRWPPCCASSACPAGWCRRTWTGGPRSGAASWPAGAASILLDNAGSTAQITALLPLRAGQPGPGDQPTPARWARPACGSNRCRCSTRPRRSTCSAGSSARIASPPSPLPAPSWPGSADTCPSPCGWPARGWRTGAGWRVADLVRRLTVEPAVLTELSAEDKTMATIFSTSYARASPDAQRVFRLLGVPSSIDFTAPAVAALADCELGMAEHVLDELVDRHLLEEPEAGRFRLHDLLRAYARSLAVAGRRRRGAGAVPGRPVRPLPVHRHHRGPAEQQRGGPPAPHRPPAAPARPGAVGLRDGLAAGRSGPTSSGPCGTRPSTASSRTPGTWPWSCGGICTSGATTRRSWRRRRLALAACEKSGDLAGAAVAHNYLGLGVPPVRPPGPRHASRAELDRAVPRGRRRPR